MRKFLVRAFSNAGKKKTLRMIEVCLFDEIIRLAKEKKPKFMFLENVKHILKVGNGEVIEYIKKKLDDNYVLNYLRCLHTGMEFPSKGNVYILCV